MSSDSDTDSCSSSCSSETSSKENFNGIKDITISASDEFISLNKIDIDNPFINSKIENNITLQLKSFSQRYQRNIKEQIKKIPDEIIDLPYYDIKEKKIDKDLEFLYKEAKNLRDNLDRFEWSQRCNDTFLYNIPMFKDEDLRIIALTTLTMGNCSFQCCTKVERLALTDSETERQKQINPLRSPPILLRFDTPANRSRFIKEFNRHNFTINDFKYMLKYTGAKDDRVYVEENLTSRNREILEKVQNLERLKIVQKYKIIDGKISIYLNDSEQGILIVDVDDLRNAIDKKDNSLEQLRILYKPEGEEATTIQPFSDYFEKWFTIKNELIEDILD